MGTAVSTQKQEQITEVLQKSMNKTVKKIENSTKTSNKIIQNMGISVNGLHGCSLRIAQDSKISVKTITENSADISNKMSNETTAKINAILAQDSTQKSTGVALGLTSVSNQSIKSNSLTNSDIQTIIEDTIKNSIEQDEIIGQTMNIGIKNSSCGKNGVYELTQKAMIDSLSNSMSDAILKTVSENKAAAEATTSLAQKAVNSIEGLGGMAIFFIIIALAIVGAMVGCAVQPEICGPLMSSLGIGKSSSSSNNTASNDGKPSDISSFLSKYKIPIGIGVFVLLIIIISLVIYNN